LVAVALKEGVTTVPYNHVNDRPSSKKLILQAYLLYLKHLIL
jgi:hypothetical protein